MSPEALLSILMCVGVRGFGFDPHPPIDRQAGWLVMTGTPPTPSASPLKTISKNATL
ncbi:hypothetical protein UFOVP381_20 [uncultured Caudovirales phage]|uniref:Uncharacterized protein n=1 Tax=uncultured Caudovirales phage TaxID=2100421 RepID=A0A6J7WZ39_9CAUD|nr:hypothetical protein UFOVP381_20 [uncultured Caudovirales phage]